MESNSLEWTHLRKALEGATSYLLDRARSHLPDNYALRDNISFVLNIGSDEFTITFNAPDYWKYVNDGRRPGKMPPIESLISWISRRNITPKAYNGKLPSINSLAFLIARKIGRDGTKGNQFLDLTIDEFESAFRNQIADAITKDIADHVDEFLKPIGNQSDK